MADVRANGGLPLATQAANGVSVPVIDPADLTPVTNLGQGSFSTVDECLLNGERVAVKRLKVELLTDEREIKGFIQEGSQIARLKHRSIVRMKALGFQPNTDYNKKPESLFMVQELCTGGSLRAKVMQQMVVYNAALYTYIDALRWSTEVSEGVAYLHAQQPLIIHRDLKLDNILLVDGTATSSVRIADFGLMTVVTESGVQEVAHDLTGQTGSYLNMAPEVVMGQPYYEKADIFSLGCIIFEVFSKAVTAAAVATTGAEDEFEQIASKVAQGYRRDMPKHWPQALKDLVALCWSQSPSDRPTAVELVAKLKSAALAAEVTEWDEIEKKRLAGCCVLQ